MDQAESSPSPGQPERQGQPSRTPPPEVSAGTGRDVPEATPLAERQSSALRLEHPVIAGYDGSASSRNALAYAAGVSQRLGRPLLVVYVCSSGVYCEPLTGQVVGVPRDAEALERWLLAELDQVTGGCEMDVHVRTRRGSPAREPAQQQKHPYGRSTPTARSRPTPRTTAGERATRGVPGGRPPGQARRPPAKSIEDRRVAQAGSWARRDLNP